MDESIADHQREFEVQKASFDVEVNKAQAEAELADDLQVSSDLLIEGCLLFLHSSVWTS